jgi:HupE/UreJ protein
MTDFGLYFQIGWQHIIDKNALDHQLFILSLAAIYLLKDWKQVLVLVTAFTIGHSLTLALSVLNIIRMNSSIVEFLIACTIIVTAISNLFQRDFTPKSIRINYFLALFFGLIHGMGFANALRSMLSEGESIVGPLFGFNLGLEVGQILVVMVVLLLSYLIVQILKVKRRDWVIFVSAAAFGLAVKMALERLPGV